MRYRLLAEFEELNHLTLFQFKTNAPARYSVKPVLASLAPNAVLEVYGKCTTTCTSQKSPVGTQQLKNLSNSPNLVRSDSEVMPEDKFLIQSLPLTAAETLEKLTSTTWRLLDRRRITENFINCTMMRGFRTHTLSSSSTRSPTPSKFAHPSPPSTPTKLTNDTWTHGASEV
ncbi:hypothetical protein INT43_007419 [Umbelopsis isabellina]|uniref:Uncharacterized protein n=1 Tax=Mortierella isabellina TaxID=91625 RepID=A0A8H7PXK8_MORIS|nr:hypothetical protein INT43_007419 [Umbelopsis isabellina]